MKVSVIIPVFNLENFIERAIQSILLQDEVVECIIVDDGSTDNTRSICLKLASQDARVLVETHAGGVNRGVSASRDLGIKLATGSHISFLDGDDYFLPNRFAEAKIAFQNNPLIDGVYDAMIDETDLEKNNPNLTTMREELIPNTLFFKMAPFGNTGHFSICALTVKTETARRIEHFNKNLVLTQDTEWIAKLALDFILVPGQIKSAVVVRGIHPNNSSKNIALLRTQRVKMCFDLLAWANKNGKPIEVKTIISKLLLKYHYEQNILFSKKSKWAKKRADLAFLLRLFQTDSSTFRQAHIVYFRNLVFGLAKGKHINFYE